ncbi:hypothetical protein MaudCBS49596_005683 [Microsporum audouinii]
MAPKTTAASSKKRRYQVPITQYFSPLPSQQTETETCSHYNYNAPTHSPHPALPPSTQASLVAVGMRVRKAVSEGYRTKTTAKATFHQPKATGQNEEHTRSSTAPVYTELIPFSGAFKVGNYGVQSFPQLSPATSEPMMTGIQLDEESLLPSSQESTQSVDSFISLPKPNPYKRGFEIEEDDDDFDTQGSFFSQPTFVHSRATLLPRSGKHRTMKSKAPTLKGRPEQENWDPAFAFDGVGGGDFEDAAFLRRREDVDADYLTRANEVRMGGI